MADKIGESVWTAFTKKQKLDLDDKPLLKALAAFDKIRESDPEPRARALDEVIRQIPEQVKSLTKKKKDLGDKLFGDTKEKLYELLEAAESLKKDFEKAVDAAAKAKGANDDDDEESPALLTGKMLPLIREIRKGDSVMQALIAVAGKETVLLLSRRAISPARGKLLKEQMTNPGGLKFIRGECLMEQNAFTFVVQAKVGGLARRIKAALFAQTELRLKVRVRGEDGEETEDEAGEAGEAGEQVERHPPTESVAANEPSEDRLAYERKLAQVEDRLAAALKARHPDAGRLRAISGLSSEKAGAGDYRAATQALATIEKLLDAGMPEAGVDNSAADAFKARLKALLPRIAAAGTSREAQAAKALANEGAVLLGKGDAAAADARLDQAEALLAHAGAALQPSATETSEESAGTAAREEALVALMRQDADEDDADALAKWQRARARAVTLLKEVAAEIAAARHANSTAALIELNAVIKNLTLKPQTLAQVDALEKWLSQDDVVQDVCDMVEDLRAPLLDALVPLRAELQS